MPQLSCLTLWSTPRLGGTVITSAPHWLAVANSAVLKLEKKLHTICLSCPPGYISRLLLSSVSIQNICIAQEVASGLAPWDDLAGQDKIHYLEALQRTTVLFPNVTDMEINFHSGI
ncbi:hypothetical protein FRC07_004207 [Ceratobasidium sp. 392]|nr:hypothetical protein FRC07_004207 [Ceratobasidium sp. 392]